MYLLLAKKCLGDAVGHSSEESGKRLPSCVDEMQSNVNIADMGGKGKGNSQSWGRGGLFSIEWSEKENPN